MKRLAVSVLLNGACLAQTPRLFVSGSFNTSQHIAGILVSNPDNTGIGFYLLGRLGFQNDGGSRFEAGRGITKSQFGVPLFWGSALRKYATRNDILSPFEYKSALDMGIGIMSRVLLNVLLQFGAMFADRVGVDIEIALGE